LRSFYETALGIKVFFFFLHWGFAVAFAVVFAFGEGSLVWIPVGLLSALELGSLEPGACWGPMVRNRGCYL
jgi:hypothetical protein